MIPTNYTPETIQALTEVLQEIEANRIKANDKNDFPPSDWPYRVDASIVARKLGYEHRAEWALKINAIKTYKNKNYKKRDYECTNFIFCQAINPPADYWIECDESEINCNQLYIQAGVKYFGHL